MDLIWTLVAFFLTIFIFSYLFGDNFLFRFATYLLVGVSAGYVFILVIFHVIIPRLIVPLQTRTGLGELLVLVVPPLIGGTLLLTKISPRLSALGTLPMAYLVGVGAAVAVGGAVFGTLMGQVTGTANTLVLSAFEGFVVLVGTVCTLAYFQFGGTARTGQAIVRPQPVEWMATAGQVFVGITLGALFAGVYTAALTALMERLAYLFTTIARFGN